MTKPRQYTTEEVRDMFLKQVRDLVDYWETESRFKTSREKLEGLAFSIMSTIDGCSLTVPGFVLAPSPHPDDAAYHREQGENWFPAGPKTKHDIAGSLHDGLQCKAHRKV